jgi:S-formylglutathione hydrolase FrmB
MRDRRSRGTCSTRCQAARTGSSPGGSRRSSARRRLGWPAGVSGFLALLLALALGVNSYVGYVPSIASARVTLSAWHLAPPPTMHHGIAQAVRVSRGHGGVEAVDIAAPASLRMPHHYPSWVYTPPGYDPSGKTRYPVMYLFHGSPGHAGDWFAAGHVPHTLDVLIKSGLIPPMIVVSVDVNGTGPSARDTECLNSTRGGAQVDTYITHVVVPYVDAHYATRADWRDRAVGGMSSGAFCALDEGLLHQDVFGGIAAIGPYGSPGSGGRGMLSTVAQFKAHSPIDYIPSMTITHHQRVFLDIGGLAHGSDTHSARLMYDELKARGEPVVLHVEPGQAHTWRLAGAGLPYALVDLWGRGA